MTRWSQSDWTAEDLVGGHPALDFVNTAGGPGKGREVERLPDYEAVLVWCRRVDTLTDEESKTLERSARGGSAEAEDILSQLRDFREALHGCLMAEQAGEPWPVASKAHVEAVIRSAIAQANLEKMEDRHGWHCTLEQAGLALPLARIALSAEDLLRREDLTRMRNCDRCSWLFIDRGRGRPRRWCSMAACGSRAKSARYYRRHKQGSGAQRA